ncbi:hypothetical protein [Corynebacterium macginleyi]|uniref:hypothetical protein n=1 Tax=Corynebacterium macginleyi TaxID=38290 RepID=UPI000EF9B02A|nr:hypothetical protein [Corynebacterium macginleyi]QRP20908.1 hypothetical protein I6J25_09490 [Corynebacterium macginleyi]RMB65075.1 hypothetical protein D9V82_09360 [Corynebacterium macginleyi]
MATVSGSLLFVSSRAAQVSEVWVHAREVRTHAGGVVTTGNDRFPVNDGEVTFTALPGPAVLALISQGRAVDTIPIVVGEGDEQSLRHVVRAGQVVDEASAREIERLSAEMMGALDSARSEAEAARGHASTAGEQAVVARGQAEAAASSAEEAKGHASSAEGHASRARSSAEGAGRAADRAEGARGEVGSARDAAVEARDAAQGHASTAQGHANAAAASAREAEGAVGRADAAARQVREIATSTRWDGDRVTVNGKQSPPLTGPRGERGPQGPPGEVDNIDLSQYARLDQLSDVVRSGELEKRFKAYRPETTSEIGGKDHIGVPIAAGKHGLLSIRTGTIIMSRGGKISLNDPSCIWAPNRPRDYSDVTNKRYVDEKTDLSRVAPANHTHRVTDISGLSEYVSSATHKLKVLKNYSFPEQKINFRKYSNGMVRVHLYGARQGAEITVPADCAPELGLFYGVVLDTAGNKAGIFTIKTTKAVVERISDTAIGTFVYPAS